MNHDRSYCLISPCKDEAEYARRTLDSILRQTAKPTRWVIVDDGSTDATPEILDAYAREHSFIQVVRRADRGGRRVGGGVIEAFNEGYRSIDPSQYAYLCKLDLDLDIPASYFETMMDKMEADPHLGTCSGKPYYSDANGNLVSEMCGDETSVGMIKFYRRECFEAIGGFVQQVMWDGIDCHRCRMLGYKAMSWDEPEIRFIHLRPMGSSHRGILTGRMRHGFGQYFMGTGLVYMAASAAFRMTRPPRIIGGAAMLTGYMKAMIDGSPRYDDLEFRSFLRRYQRNCLIKGKAAATRELNERIDRGEPTVPV